MASKNWCFTINNPSAEVLDRILSEKIDDVMALVCQAEVGEKGTPHLQGCFQLKRKVRLGGAKKVFGAIAHYEVMKGRWEQAAAYCQKEDTRAEGGFTASWGVPTTQGKRTDLAVLHTALLEGASNKVLWGQQFATMAKYFKAVDRYHLEQMEPRTTAPTVYVLYGDAGTGKSRSAYDFAKSKGLEIYSPVAPNGSKSLWWDGYAQQPVVVLDDFYGWITWSSLLRLLDRYAVKVQSKGGSVEFNSPHIFITSNAPPEQWYYAAPGRMEAALYRRFSIVTEMRTGLPEDICTADYHKDQMPHRLRFTAKE